MCPSRGARSIKCLVSKTSFSPFFWCQTHGAKGRAPSGVPLMIRNHPCQPWEGRWSVGLPVWTTSRLPPLKMQRETTVDDRSSCTVMSVVMCGIPFAGGAAEGRVPPLSLFCLVLRGGVGQLEKHEPDTSA